MVAQINQQLFRSALKSTIGIRARIAVLCALTLILAYLIATKSLPLSLAEIHPHIAMRLDTSSVSARLSLASDVLASASDKSDDADLADRHARARAWVVEALIADPFNARGLELLGQISIETGDEAAADRFMRASAARSLRRRTALYWLSERAFARGNYEEASRFADALLRGAPRAMALVSPVLTRMIELPAAQQEVAKLLSAGPPWRPEFFAHLRSGLTKPDAPLQLFLALKNSTHPPADKEIAAYLRLLIDKRDYDLAYASWLQLLTDSRLASAGWLYNGSFAHPLSGAPFDWSIKAGRGVTIDILPAADRSGQFALAIEAGPGRVNFLPVHQTLALPAGRYTLSGLFKGSIRGDRGFRWTVGCSERPLKVGETQMFLGDIPGWTEFSAAIDVPDDCRLQTIKLVLDARSESETFVSGTIWFTDLSVVRN